MDVVFLPLVPQAVVPVPSPAATRSPVPSGYGVQEQCLPFTAATALGLLIRSPISFGVCQPQDVPPDGHAFRSPLDSPDAGVSKAPSVFYVKDDQACRFTGNAFTFEVSGGDLVPGLSFFDRPDQQDLFKIHLPYLCRTSAGIDALFLTPINRPAPFTVLSGLVETDWYASPVNLILRRPSGARPGHVAKGDTLAQVVFISREHRRPEVRVLAEHARHARELKLAMAEWDQHHREDRNAYKRLVRTQHGQLIHETGCAAPETGSGKKPRNGHAK